MNREQLDEYEKQLLDAWENVSKRGQLSLWLLLSLKESPKFSGDISTFIYKYTNGVVSVDDQSLYRALRRYKDAEMVSYKVEPGDGGGERKIYTLTATGLNVLNTYLKRNVEDLFYKDDIKQLICGR